MPNKVVKIGGKIIAESIDTEINGRYNHAEGYGTIAGMLGYFYSSIEFGNEIFDSNGKTTKTYGPCKITFTKVQPDDITLAPIPEPFAIGYAVGDVLSFVNDGKYIKCSTITAIENNIVTVNSLPFKSIKNMAGDVAVDDYQVFCPDKPQAGEAPLGYYAHVEGEGSWAIERASHAEGRKTKAEGQYSHAEGQNTIASSSYQHVQGRYNVEDTENKYADIIGGGTGNAAKYRKNIQTTDWSGNLWTAGSVTAGRDTTDDDNDLVLVSKGYLKSYVESAIKAYFESIPKAEEVGF